MTPYSTSAMDREIVDCFLAFHETKQSPKNIQKSVTDFQVSGHAPQSASEKSFKCCGDEMRKRGLGLVCFSGIIRDEELSGDKVSLIEP